MTDLIRRKRFGEELTSDEIDFLVRGYTEGRIPDYQMAAWLMAVCCRDMTPEETMALTMALVRSGRVLDLEELTALSVDKHSTGAVGDKTTLVLAPLVAATGLTVAKMSGRALGITGGTLDKLESIPGLRVGLSPTEFLRQLRSCGVAIAGQSQDLTPADGKLYALRDVTATVDSIPLVASSIMSKKIAAGARSIVLDIKMGLGAIARTVEEATSLARAMLQIGQRAHLQVATAITNADQPLGRAVGNSLEVREAIETLKGKGPPDLVELCRELGVLMLITTEVVLKRSEALDRLETVWQSGLGLGKLRELIEAQGGDSRVIDDPEILPRAAVIEDVPSPRDGWVQAIDAAQIGSTVSNLGAGRQRKDEPIDHAVGLVLEAKTGDRVRWGERLATIHARSVDDLDYAAERVVRAYPFADQPVRQPPVVCRILTAVEAE